MKRVVLLIVLLFIPFIVKAENVKKEYELCQSGCEYSDINTIFYDVKSVDKTKVYDFIIEVKDGGDYVISRTYGEMWYTEGSEAIKSSFTLKGTGEERPTFSIENHSYSIRFLSVKKVTLENINIDENSVDFHTNYYSDELDSILTVKNVDIRANDMWIRGDIINYENVKINTGSILSDGGNKATFKNVEITLNDNGVQPFGISFEGTEDTFENSTINMNGKKFIASKLNLINSTVNGSISAIDDQTYNDSKINGSLKLEDGSLNFDNVEVTNGISISRLYCTDYNNSFMKSNNTIKNSKISNPNGNAINLKVRDKDVIIDIDNTDLSNCACSIVSESPTPQFCPGANYIQNIRPTYLAAASFNSQINVSNSKVNCAKTSSTDLTLNAVNMYFDATNVWTKAIKRGIDPETFNVVELQNGHIYIEFKNEDTLKLNVDKDKNIADYFKAILPEGQVLGEWLIEDESILKIVDGKITPLKVGKTSISSVIDGNVYSVYITVTSDDLGNPDTKDIIIAALSTSFMVAIIIVIAYFKYKEVKI